MKAIVQTAYGSPNVLELRDIDKPMIGDRDLSIRVQAAGVHRGDWLVMRGLPYIAAWVSACAHPSIRLRGWRWLGRWSESGRMRRGFSQATRYSLVQWRLRRIRLSARASAGHQACQHYVETSSAFPISAFAALQALRDTGRMQPAHKVLIIGASGGVGTFAVQIANRRGGSDRRLQSRNVEMVRSIGADHVIDYARQEFVDVGRSYDVILDTAGNRSLSYLRRALTPKGTLVLVGGSGGPWLMGTERTLRALMVSPFVRQRLRGFLSQPKKEDLAVLKELIDAGKVTPVIDRTYRLSEVPEAMRYLEERHPGGKLLTTM